MKSTKTLSIVSIIVAIILSFASVGMMAHTTSETECANNPDRNNGHCVERAEGNGYMCMKSLWMVDCYKTIVVDDEIIPIF